MKPRWGFRRGITLLEVMIAVMVLGIGLVGVGALVSVGALQAQRASVDDHKAIIGQAGVRDDKVRGFCHSENWLTASGSYFMQLSSSPALFPADVMGNTNNIQPVAIDPLMVGAFGSAVSSFLPPGGGSNLAMPRLTINTLASVASQQACISEDDMFFINSTTNADLLPTGGYNSVGTKREFVAQYSWLATLVPAYGDLQPTETRNLMLMSVVVFNQRQFSIAPQAPVAPAIPTERSCQVTLISGTGQGGGDLMLSGSSANAVSLRVGECLMLGWQQLDVPSNGSGKAAAFSATSTYGTQQNPSPSRPMFRWYRILNAGPPTGAGSTWTRYVTVAGADLNPSIIVNYPSGPNPNPGSSIYAFIYDGAVAVYERTVRLEGPSMWTY